jgi:hypothetical protein
MMAEYYQNAFITLLATSSDSKSGLFPEKIGRTPRLARLPYRDVDGNREGCFDVCHYNDHLDHQYQSAVQKSELMTRGWVFQG